MSEFSSESGHYSRTAHRLWNFWRLSLWVVFVLIKLGSTPSPLLGTASSDRFEAILKEGFNLHERQQYGRAIPLLEEARTLKPADYFVNLLLGIDYLRLGEVRKALPRLETARTTHRDDPTALGYLAEAYSSLHEFDRAAEALQRSVEAPDSSDQSRLSLVKFYLQRFRMVSAELRSTSTGLAYSYRLRALVLHDRGDPNEYQALLQASALEPRLPGLETALGEFHLLAGRWEQARENFTRARAQNPNDLDLIVSEAILAAYSQDWNRAKLLLSDVGSRSRSRLAAALREWPAALSVPKDLESQIAVPPLQSDALTASEAFHQQRWENLIERFRSSPETTEGSWWLGVALARLERFTEGIVPLERARTELAFRAQADYWLALCYARAVEKMKTQLSNSERNPLVHLIDGEVMLRLALDGTAAVTEYRRAVTAFPQDPVAWTGLAEAQLLTGDTQEARQSANRALGLDVNRIEASQVLGEACIQERDYRAAIPPLERALQAQPSNQRVRLLLGTAYSRSQRDQEACLLLEAVLKEGYPDEKGTTHYLLGTVLRRLGRLQDSARAFEEAKVLSDAFASSGHSLAPRSEPVGRPASESERK